MSFVKLDLQTCGEKKGKSLSFFKVNIYSRFRFLMEKKNYQNEKKDSSESIASNYSGCYDMI